MNNYQQPLKSGLFLITLIMASSLGCQQMPFGSKSSSTTATTPGKRGFLRPSLPHLAWWETRKDKPSVKEEPIARITPQQEADVQFAQARLLEKEGEFDKAVILYKEVVKRDKSRADAFHRLGVITCMQSQYDASNEWFKKAMKANANDREIGCDYGYSLYMQGRLNEAEATLKKVLTVNPNHCRTHNNLALVYAHSHRVDEAVDQFGRGGATEAESYANVALALALDGDLDQSRQLYIRALDIDQSCSAAKKGLKDLEPVIAKANEKTVRFVGHEEQQP